MHATTTTTPHATGATGTSAARVPRHGQATRPSGCAACAAEPSTSACQRTQPQPPNSQQLAPRARACSVSVRLCSALLSPLTLPLSLSRRARVLSQRPLALSPPWTLRPSGTPCCDGARPSRLGASRDEHEALRYQHPSPASADESGRASSDDRRASEAQRWQSAAVAERCGAPTSAASTSPCTARGERSTALE